VNPLLSLLKVFVENVSKRINLMEEVLYSASKVEYGSIASCQPQFYIYLIRGRGQVGDLISS
jgi:hypothetical protein